MKKTKTYTIIRIEQAQIEVPENIEPDYRMEYARNHYRDSHCKFDERSVFCIEGNDRVDFDKILTDNIKLEKI